MEGNIHNSAWEMMNAAQLKYYLFAEHKKQQETLRKNIGNKWNNAFSRLLENAKKEVVELYSSPII